METGVPATGVGPIEYLSGRFTCRWGTHAIPAKATAVAGCSPEAIEYFSSDGLVVATTAATVATLNLFGLKRLDLGTAHDIPAIATPPAILAASTTENFLLLDGGSFAFLLFSCLPCCWSWPSSATDCVSSISPSSSDGW